MLPPLTADGTLPPGVHAAQLEEIVGQFGGGNPTRDECGRRVQLIVEMAKGTGHLKRAFVWGSFVTAKPQPADVDLLLVMNTDFRSEWCSPLVRQVFDGAAAQRLLGATALWTREDCSCRPPELILGTVADRSRRPTARDRRGDSVITNDSELLAAQARVQVIQAMLAHARRTCTAESFHDQAKGWLAEWKGLDEEIRAYLSTPAALTKTGP